MTRDGKSEASCCFVSWMLEANWMVPARMRLLPGTKLNLQKSNHLLCNGHGHRVQTIDMLIMTTRTDISLKSNVSLCFSPNHDQIGDMQNNRCKVAGILAEQAVHPFIQLCCAGRMLETLQRHVSCSFTAIAFHSLSDPCHAWQSYPAQ